MKPVTATATNSNRAENRTRAQELFGQSQQGIHERTDAMFAWVMLTQWLAAIITALWISPRTWIGATGQVLWHVWGAILLGGAIAVVPVFLAFCYAGRPRTRQVIAICQMLMSALLIHLAGGRIETHFHIFGSLAFLAFYRDGRVLVTATAVAAADHMVRGILWPQSVFGLLSGGGWRGVEHVGWILFEDTFLWLAIRQSLRELLAVAEHRAKLEQINADIERTVTRRTAELTEVHQGLQASELRFRTLSASAPIGIFLSDARGQMLYFNPYWLGLSGLTGEESLGTGWHRALHPEDAIDVLRDWKRAATNGWQFDREFRLLTRQGETKWVRAVVVTIRSAGKMNGRVGTIEDITERRRSVEVLRLQEAALRSTANVVVITNRQGNIVWTNPAFTAVTGYTAEEALGKNPSILKRNGASTSQRANYFQELWTTIVSGAVWAGEFQNSRKDGTLLIEEATITPVRDEQGTITHFVAVKQDITERKQAQEQLARAQRELLALSRRAGMAEVATGVLHNVGNVLNSVNVASSCLADALRKSRVANLGRVVELLQAHRGRLDEFLAADPKGKQVLSYLGQLSSHLKAEQTAALSELQHLQKKIDHIKDIVAMQQNFATTSRIKETILAVDLVEDAVQMNQSLIQGQGLQVIREFQPTPPVTVEKHKALQILVNLIRNANQACEAANRDDKQLTLRIMAGADCVRISVSDNGVGIPPENLTRIFGHGFTTKRDGHGFGLHSGALAAKEMGGTLHAESPGIGAGATFILELPAAPEIGPL